MAGNPSSFPHQVQEVWSRLKRPQQWSIIALVIVVSASMGTLVFFINRVEYQVLYRDMNPEDAQAIAARLKEDKRDFLVSSDGSSIQVAGSKSEVDKIRLDIAGSGLARTGKVGFEIFDKSQFGMTDFTEQVNYRRALEGELSRTISSLAEIQMARVHLVLPKDSIFEEKKEEAKASVMVRLKQGSELAKGHITGIVNLVAAAVEGLRTQNVSVVDWEGNLLSRPIAAVDGLRAEIEASYRSQMEKELVNKVISILEPVVGKGKVHANASIDLDFNSTEQTEETFNPNTPVILSQQKSEERVGRAAAPSGIPGTRANQSPPADPQPPSAPERLRQSEATNYEISKMVRHTVQPKGTVKRLSVAVILDHKTVFTKGSDGKVVPAPQPRKQEELDSFRDLVLAAVGFDQNRGDTVTLENVPFFNETPPEEEVPPAIWYIRYQHYLLPGMKYVAFLLVFLLTYLILFRPVTKRVLRSIDAALPHPPAVEALSAVPGLPAVRDGTSLPAGSEAKALPEGIPHLEQDGIPVVNPAEAIDEQIEKEFMKEAELLNVGARKKEILRKRISDQAKSEPELVAQLLRTWIHES